VEQSRFGAAGDGQFADAVGCLNRAVELRPQYPEALSNLGSALLRLDKPDDAAIALTAALNSGLIFPRRLTTSAGSRRRAASDLTRPKRYRAAIALRPGYAEAHYNLAIALRAGNDLLGAIQASQAAIEARPNFPEAINNLGVLLLEDGRTDDAISVLQSAIQNRSHLRRRLQQSRQRPAPAWQVARGQFRATSAPITLRDGYAEAHSNLGNALQQLGRLTESISAFQAALEINPNLSEAHNNLGNVFKDQGELDNALASYERAAALSTDAVADSNRVYTLHYHSDFTASRFSRAPGVERAPRQAAGSAASPA